MQSDSVKNQRTAEIRHSQLLPFRCPVYKLAPILALMLNPEAILHAVFEKQL